MALLHRQRDCVLSAGRKPMPTARYSERRAVAQLIRRIARLCYRGGRAPAPNETSPFGRPRRPSACKNGTPVAARGAGVGHKAQYFSLKERRNNPTASKIGLSSPPPRWHDLPEPPRAHGPRVNDKVPGNWALSVSMRRPAVAAGRQWITAPPSPVLFRPDRRMAQHPGQLSRPTVQ